ncbi:MAG: metallophosphoesterase family protein [Chloroflexi bacterium]|nr:metallophosphoesterase family protein [Chloroflexota bacterium]
MNVVVLSDTHLPSRVRALPDAVIAALREADLIIHAGDFTTFRTFQELCRYAPVEGVCGNVDEPEIRWTLPRIRRFQADGFTFGVIHGDGGNGSPLNRAIEAFSDNHVDCVVFGHSHQPHCEVRNGVTYVNPGSATDRRRAPHASFAVLRLGTSIEVEWQYL